MSGDSRCPSARKDSAESGSAVLLALLVTALIAALGIGLATMAETDRMIAGNFQNGLQALHASEAAAEHSRFELARLADWTTALTGIDRSAFMDASSSPTTDWGEQLDLVVLTQALQVETNAASRSGSNTPVWRMYASGPLDALTRTVTHAVPTYLIAWVGDDVADSDGNPMADANGIVLLRVQAMQQGGVKRSVQLVLKRDVVNSFVSLASADPRAGGRGPDSVSMARFLRGVPRTAQFSGGPDTVRILSWREVR